MAVSTITGFAAILDADLTDAALLLFDDANAHTRKGTVAQLRTRIVKPTDATVDLGIASTNRFRDLFLSRDASIGGTASVGNAVITSALIAAGSGLRLAYASGVAALYSYGVDASTNGTWDFLSRRSDGSNSIRWLRYTPTSSLLSWEGHMVATTDATYDIGASGGTRFRDLFLSRNAVIGGTFSAGDTTLQGLSPGNTALVVNGNYSAGGVVNLTSWRRDSGGAVSMRLRYDDANVQMRFGTDTAHDWWLERGGTAIALIGSTTISMNSGLIAYADGTYDIGQSGAQRFRDLFLSRHIKMAGDFTMATNSKMAVGNSALNSSYAFYVYSSALAGIAQFERNGGTAATNGILSLDFSSGLTGSTAADAIWSGPVNGGIRFQTNGTQIALDLVKSGASEHGGNVIARTDATYDIGVSGANRFRDLFLSRNLQIGDSFRFGAINDASGNNHEAATRFAKSVFIGVGSTWDFDLPSTSGTTNFGIAIISNQRQTNNDQQTVGVYLINNIGSAPTVTPIGAQVNGSGGACAFSVAGQATGKLRITNNSSFSSCPSVSFYGHVGW